MADATLTMPETEQRDVLAVTTETVTYAVYRNITDGKLGAGILKEGNALWKSANGDNPTREILRTVQVTSPVVNSVAGLSEVVPDEDEAVLIINKGLDSKIDQQVRARIMATNEAGDFSYPEEEIPLEQTTEMAATPLQRRSQTEGQKAVKILKSLSEDERIAVLRALGINL